jgi:hypothetical protein
MVQLHQFFLLLQLLLILMVQLHQFFQLHLILLRQYNQYNLLDQSAQ